MIPQVLDGRVPAADACVVDLGCGPGSSTQLISWFARPAWRIIGYELIEHQIEEARYWSWWKTNKSGTGAAYNARFSTSGKSTTANGCNGAAPSKRSMKVKPGNSISLPTTQPCPRRFPEAACGCASANSNSPVRANGAAAGWRCNCGTGSGLIASGPPACGRAAKARSGWTYSRHSSATGCFPQAVSGG